MVVCAGFKVYAVRLISLLLAGLSLVSCVPQKELVVFATAASRPAIEEAAVLFQEKTGIRVVASFGGSGTMLSQIKLARRGDVFIAASPEYMEKAEKEGIIEAGSVRVFAYLVPALLVRKGNPQNIRSLSDLARPGLKVGIANPEVAPVGLYAYELLEYNGLVEEVRKNGTIVTYAEDYGKLVSLVALKKLDAAIGWDLYAKWQPDKVEAVYLQPGELPRISYIPGAVVAYTRDRLNARRFLDFLSSPQGQEVFRKWGYLATEAEARKLAPYAVVGGTYKPAEYKPLVSQ